MPCGRINLNVFHHMRSPTSLRRLPSILRHDAQHSFWGSAFGSRWYGPTVRALSFVTCLFGGQMDPSLLQLVRPRAWCLYSQAIRPPGSERTLAVDANGLDHGFAPDMRSVIDACRGALQATDPSCLSLIMILNQFFRTRQSPVEIKVTNSVP